VIARTQPVWSLCHTMKDKLCIVIVPSLNDYKYLQHLYAEVSLISQKNDLKISFYSPNKKPSSFLHLLLYPFKIILNLVRRKSCEKLILHLHWIEFFYRFGNNKCLVPLLAPLGIVFFKFFKRLSRIQIAITLHNLVPHDVYWFSLEYAFFRIMLQKIADRVFVHTKVSKKLSAMYYGLDDRTLVLIEHGLFRQPKMLDNLSRMHLRRQLNISENDVVFCFVGNISKYKGIEILLEAVREIVSQKLINTKFIIIGKPDSGYLDYLLTKYNDVITNDRVIFKPEHVPEIEFEKYLTISDFGVCPYIRATTPSTLLDLMSFKLPIITSDDPNVMEVLKEYPSIIAKRGDVHSLTNALNIAYCNALEYKQRANAFDISDLFCAWKRAAEKTFKEYLKITGIEGCE